MTAESQPVRAVEPLPPGPTARTLTAVPGTDLDPPDIDPPIIHWAVSRDRKAAWWWRWWERYRDGRGALSAKGIAFYSFFGVLSGLALAFAVGARVPQYEQFLVEVVNQALPGLIGPGGVDPEQLTSVGSTVGLIGAAVLVYSAIGIVRAVADGVRLTYGVQYEPRNFTIKNLRYLAYLLLLAPVVGLSYVGSSASAGLFAPLLRSLGFDGAASTAVVITGGVAIGVALNTVVIMVVISRLGGVCPPRWRWQASLVAGAALEVVKVGAAYFVALTVGNPRYLSFGAPVAMLLLFYAMASVVLAAAAFVATANEPEPVLTARRQQLPKTAPSEQELLVGSPDQPVANS